MGKGSRGIDAICHWGYRSYNGCKKMLRISRNDVRATGENYVLHNSVFQKLLGYVIFVSYRWRINTRFT